MPGLWYRVTAIIRRDGGRSADELARMLDEPVKVVSSACWALCRLHRLDFCAGYFVLAVPAKAAPVRRAA
jgi:hypothetical protein